MPRQQLLLSKGNVPLVKKTVITLYFFCTCRYCNSTLNRHIGTPEACFVMCLCLDLKCFVVVVVVVVVVKHWPVSGVSFT